MVLIGIWPGLFQLVHGVVFKAVSRINPGAFYPFYNGWSRREGKAIHAMNPMGSLGDKLTGILYACRDDVIRFFLVGQANIVWVCLLSLAILFSRLLVPYLCVRFQWIETSTLVQILEVQIPLSFLIFFAPIPGGAGLAEGASLSFMAGIVPIGFAPYYHFLWRFSALYLPAIAGLFCLLWALVQDLRVSSIHNGIKGCTPISLDKGSLHDLEF